MTENITAGVDATMYWNVAPYSDMSLLNGDTRDENSHLFKIFNESFHGNLMSSQSQEPSKVMVYAVANQANTGIYAFSLINRTENPQTINLDFNGMEPADMTLHVSDANNEFSTRDTSWNNLNQGNLVLSPYSVNLFVAK